MFFLTDNNKVAHWWMGEKYDGIRVFWNPKITLLFSRQGNLIKVQNYFVQNLLNYFLDGEFWFGRKKFLAVMHLSYFCYDDDSPVEWGKMRYMVFDCPSPELINIGFEKRYSQLFLNNVSHPFLIQCPRVLCTNKLHIFQKKIHHCFLYL